MHLRVIQKNKFYGNMRCRPDLFMKQNAPQARLQFDSATGMTTVVESNLFHKKISIFRPFPQSLSSWNLFKYCKGKPSSLVTWTQLISADFSFKISEISKSRRFQILLSRFFFEKSRQNVARIIG